jgi:hypothetical protein
LRGDVWRKLVGFDGGRSIPLTGAGVGGTLAGEFGLLRIGEARGAGIDFEESSNDQSILWDILERTGKRRITAYSSGEVS